MSAPFPTLATTPIKANTGPTEAWMLVLHGVLGRGHNLRRLAQDVMAQRPGLGALLVDLPGHGHSPAEPEADALSLTAVAQQIAALAGRMSQPVTEVVGHSLGGKVALSLALEAPVTSLRHVWMLDAEAGPSPVVQNLAWPVLRWLEEVRFPVPSRAAFLAQAHARGWPETLSAWLASGLVRRADDSFDYRTHLPSAAALLQDYAEQDLRPKLSAHRGPHIIHLLVGARSDAVSAATQNTLHQLQAAGAPVRVHAIADAGHWMHVDAPSAVATTLAMG
ncbi:MAG: alpha/beta fold hydrolase [Polyangiales bacterium]